MIGRSSARDVKANVKTTKLTANYTRTVELISALGTGIVLWFGTRKVLARRDLGGDLLVSWPICAACTSRCSASPTRQQGSPRPSPAARRSWRSST